MTCIRGFPFLHDLCPRRLNGINVVSTFRQASRSIQFSACGRGNFFIYLACTKSTTFLTQCEEYSFPYTCQVVFVSEIYKIVSQKQIVDSKDRTSSPSNNVQTIQVGPTDSFAERRKQCCSTWTSWKFPASSGQTCRVWSRNSVAKCQILIPRKYKRVCGLMNWCHSCHVEVLEVHNYRFSA